MQWSLWLHHQSSSMCHFKCHSEWCTRRWLYWEHSSLVQYSIFNALLCEKRFEIDRTKCQVTWRMWPSSVSHSTMHGINIACINMWQGNIRTLARVMFTCIHSGRICFLFCIFLSLSHTLILVPCPCGHANFVVAYLSSRTITTTKLNVNFILHAEIMPSMCCCMTVPVNKCEIMYA